MTARTMAVTDAPVLLTVAETAEVMHCTPQLVRRLCAAGDLSPAYQHAARGPWLVDVEAITSYLKSHSNITRLRQRSALRRIRR